MAQLSKRQKAEVEAIDRTRVYSIDEASQLIKDHATSKFDETIEISINLNVDPRHSDQMVRGVISLPHGTGKTLRVAVFAKGDKADEAKAAFLNQVLETQASIHVLLRNRHHKAQVGLHHFFFGSPAQHQPAAEANERHFNECCPLFFVGLTPVVALKLCGEFFEMKQIGNFAGQFDFFVGT